MMDFIKNLHAAFGNSPKVFILMCALFGFFVFGAIGLVMDLAYRADQKREQEKQRRAEDLSGGPYLILEYSPTQNGPSGFLLRNDGQQNAVRVHINDITIKGRVARFGEIASVRNSGQTYGTYPSEVELLPGENRLFMNDLENVFGPMSPEEEVNVTVDYWETNNMREYRTVATFKKEQFGGVSGAVSLVTTRREIVSE